MYSTGSIGFMRFIGFTGFIGFIGAVDGSFLWGLKSPGAGRLVV